MTLIACVRVEGVSVLIGDLMISTDTPHMRAVSLPTTGDLANPRIANSNGYIAGLAQKVVTINDQLMIAWSGSKIYATSILKQLKYNTLLYDDNAKALKKTFSEFTEVELENCQFIGLVSQDQKVHSFHVGAYSFDHDSLGSCIVGGSGAGSFIHSFCSKGEMPIIEGKMRDVDIAVTYALTSVSTFLGRELVAEDPHQFRFGGGYEIGTLTTDGAEKLSDILHLFWRWRKGHDRVPKLLPTLIKVDYLGRDLVVQRVHQSLVGKRYVLDDHVVHVVGSPIEPIADAKPTPPPLNPEILSSFYFGTSDDQIATSMNTVYRSKNKAGPLTIKDKSGEISMNFNLEHFKKEHDIVVDILQQQLAS